MRLPQIVIPMAGDGRRFSTAGYALPKPLLPVNNQPMAIQAVRDLPEASRVIFLVRSEHIDRFQIDRKMKAYLPNAVIVPVEKLTAGQACTVRLAAEHLDPELPVIVGACDNTHVYDKESLARAMAAPDFSCLVWTYRGDPRVLRNPTAYGWVRTESDDTTVRFVSCKTPISQTPIEDQAVSGFFSFNSARTMNRAIDALVAEGQTINGEYYLDNVPNVLLKDGLTVKTFLVRKYIGWGTPAEYEDCIKSGDYGSHA